MNHKAVILGANYYIGLSVIRGLGRKGVHTVAIEYQEEGTYGFKSRYLKEKLLAPHYKRETRAFIDYLIDFAKKQNDKPVLFPCADPYVEVIDAHLDELKNYYLIAQEKQGLFTELMDKNALYDLALQHEVRVPETIKTTEINLIERVENEIGYPCIVKPSDSPSFVKVFRHKLFQVENKEELLEKIELAKSHNLEVFIQRIVPGFDDHMYTFDCYLNQNSKVTHYMTCNKKRQYPINFGASVYTSQEHVQALYDIGAPFLEAVGFKGFAEIEFKKDAENGEFYLIEINVRTTNLNVLLEKVGINFPYLQYRELIGESIGTKFFTQTTKRTFVYGLEDALAIKGYLKTKQQTVSQILRLFWRKKAYAIWALDDPKPYFYFIGTLLKKVGKKMTKRG
ncbi:MAG: carboxylate--amine ligase [Clostridia bacterium]|nr:carboxylate--amine ligase [Clostridia bacterium]